MKIPQGSRGRTSASQFGGMGFESRFLTVESFPMLAEVLSEFTGFLLRSKKYINKLRKPCMLSSLKMLNCQYYAREGDCFFLC